MIKKYITTSYFLTIISISFVGCHLFDINKQPPFDASIKGAKSVIVIGSGPAGFNAALYAGRAGIKPYVILGNEPGGALTKTSYVENWIGEQKILGVDLITRMKDHAKVWGAEFIDDSVVSVDFSHRPFTITLASGEVMHAHALIIATGSKPKLLAIPGEEEYWGKGVTTCAICDAPFYKGKEVVVVGGGDSAAEEALQLTSFARKIYILVRKDRMRAAEYLQKRLKSFVNIEIIYNVEVQRINGDEKHVTSIELKDARTHELKNMPINGVFLAIGSIPNTEIFKPYLKTDDHGHLIMKDRTQETTISGIYAAGDVENPEKQAIIAAGSSSEAMIQALRWLNTLNIPLDQVEKFPENEDANQTIQKEPQKLVKQEKQSVSALRILKNVSELNDIILQAKGPVLVDFYADYCSSCMKMLPYMEKAAQHFGDKASFYKVDVAEAPEIAQQFDISSLPTILIFHKGNINQRINKAMTYQEINDLVDQVLGY